MTLSSGTKYWIVGDQKIYIVNLAFREHTQ